MLASVQNKAHMMVRGMDMMIYKYYCLSVHLPTCACESVSTDIVKVIRNNTHWSTSTGGCCKEPKPYREHLKINTSVQNRVHAIDCHDL